MIALPAWAQCNEARALIAAILDERPGGRPYTPHEGASWCETRFKGRNASALRQLYDDAYLAEIDRANAEAAAGKPWPQARNEALARLKPNADALIEQLLEEAGKGLPVQIDDDGTARIAA